MKLIFKRLVTVVTLQALILSQSIALAQSAHVEGLAAGNAANAAARPMVNEPLARSVVPGYTSTPSQTSLAGRPALATEANAARTNCTLTPDDPSCQAIQTAITSASTVKPLISAADPSVAAAQAIVKNPSLAISDVAAYYSGCSASATEVPSRTETRTCTRTIRSAQLACGKKLTVDVNRTTNCVPGDWFARGAAFPTEVAIQCLPNRPLSAQRGRITYKTDPPVFTDLNMTAGSIRPTRMFTLETINSPFTSASITRSLYFADISCGTGGCSFKAMTVDEPKEICSSLGEAGSDCKYIYPPFFDVYAPCPGGTQSGDKLVVGSTCSPGDASDSCKAITLAENTCYRPAPPPDPKAPPPDPKDPPPPPPPIAAVDSDGSFADAYWYADHERRIVGWKVNPDYGPMPMTTISYVPAAHTYTTADHWTDYCPAEVSGRCTPSGPPVCTEGPATKVVDGAPITRTCWEYQQPVTCANSNPVDQCAALVAAGCTPESSTCTRTDPVSGECDRFVDSYSCTFPEKTVAQMGSCPSNVYCIEGNCFDIGHAPDADFARTMTMLEAGREAGIYLDTDRMKVFNGDVRFCRNRLLKNCCASDATGAGMTNQSVFGMGASRVVFDALMDANNWKYVTSALVSSLSGYSEFNGTFGVSAYGLSVQFFTGDAAVTYSGNLLWAGAISDTTGMLVAFDPWSLVIAIAIQVIMAAMSCDAEEAKTAMSEGANLCHSVGTWCSHCVRGAFGECASCITHKTGKCCFNSVLARVVNEQGRMQLGKGWGSAKEPDCSGFTVAELQSLNFAAMDLSEFYASLVDTPADWGALQQQNAAKVSSCYYGAGKC